jgi:periplasmic copper chaperone A
MNSLYRLLTTDDGGTSMRPITLLLAALLAGAALPLCAAEPNITISDPYVRLLPPGAPTSATYLVLNNPGGVDRRLVKAESGVAKTVELHEHRNENGVMKMRAVDSIVIKAHGQTELKPGGYHVMLIGLKNALKEGDRVVLTLVFDDGSRQQIDAPVRKVQADMPAAMRMDHGAMKHN